MAKRSFGIILFVSAILLSACTPQKRLARIVRQHPELQTKTIQLTDTFVAKYLYKDTVIALPVAYDNDTTTGIISKSPTEAVTIGIGNARATLTPQTSTDNRKQWKLAIEQMPDTVIRTRTVTIPAISVTTKAELTRWQQFCYSVGFWCLFAFVLFVGYRVIKTFFL